MRRGEYLRIRKRRSAASRQEIGVKIIQVQVQTCVVRCCGDDLVGPPRTRRTRSSRERLVKAIRFSVMTQTRRLLGLATATVVVVAVTGCANSGTSPATSGSPNPSSPAPTTAVSTPQSDSEVASADSTALVRRYYGTLDTVRQHIALPLSRLSGVATSVELSSLTTLVGGERAKGQHQTGATKIAKLVVQSVNLDNADPAAGRVPTVQIDVCWNVTSVGFLDASGHSIVSPGRPDTGWTRLTVANYHYAADPTQGWRVATSQDLTRKPCAAS